MANSRARNGGRWPNAGETSLAASFSPGRQSQCSHCSVVATFAVTMPPIVCSDCAKVGVDHLNHFERIAVVTDVGWLRNLAHGVGQAIPGELRVFAVDELPEASDWIAEA